METRSGNVFQRLALLMFGCLPVLVFALDDSTTALKQSGERYLPSAHPMMDVDRALNRAAVHGRLALIVLGANWCHDSRALASRLYQEPLSELIEKHYEVVFVDVGYYEKGKDVIRRFGSPIYYATPTVLIVDPGSGQLINADNRHQWGNAHDIGMDETVAYFEQMVGRSAPAAHQQHPLELDRLTSEIDSYERRLAERVEAAFAVIGPMLKDYKEGRASDDFDARWKEVSDFRNKIPRDMQALSAEAERRISAGENEIQLALPDYPPFSWENADSTKRH